MKKGYLEKIVFKLLKEYPITRKDDFILIAGVYKMLGIDLNRSFKDVMKNHDKLPSFESITRCRRKMQAKNEELIDKKTEKIRKEEELKYFMEYGRKIK